MFQLCFESSLAFVEEVLDSLKHLFTFQLPRPNWEPSIVSYLEDMNCLTI